MLSSVIIYLVTMLSSLIICPVAMLSYVIIYRVAAKAQYRSVEHKVKVNNYLVVAKGTVPVHQHPPPRCKSQCLAEHEGIDPISKPEGWLTYKEPVTRSPSPFH